MASAKDALIKAHRDNIRRYRRLLESHLTDTERSYVQARISEQQSALQSMFGPGTLQSEGNDALVAIATKLH